MNIARYIILTFFILNLYRCNAYIIDAEAEKEVGWKAGVATVVITPEQPLWMGGYASREHTSEGTLHELKAKALVLEDAKGKQSVLVTTDILGYPKEMSDNIRKVLYSKFGLSKAQVILNSSHTHSGPALAKSLVDVYSMNSQEIEDIVRYSDKLEEAIVDLVEDALNEMQVVSIFSGNGEARFQVNRRNNNEKTLAQQTELYGPNDYTVSVLKVVDDNEKVIAVVFGYACHPTVLNGYEWCGDFPGFAQLELDKLYPEATTLFFQSSGADQNPLPRRTLSLAIKYGKQLSASVECVLTGKMNKLAPELYYSYSEISLDLINQPNLEELIDLEENSKGYIKRWAMRMASKKKNGESISSSYSYPVQFWSLGNLPIVSLGGELVTEYSLEIRRLLGQQCFVLGYSNDVMGYIPTSTILQEGGYEAVESQMVYGLFGYWSPEIESKIISEVLRLSKEVHIPLYSETDISR